VSEQQNIGIPEGFKMEETTTGIQYLVQEHKIYLHRFLYEDTLSMYVIGCYDSKFRTLLR
jgi:hypothetical protein